jgi:hypothetical protein
MRRVAHVACTGEMRNAYNILIGNPEAKGPLARSGRRWKDNIKMYLNDVKCETVHWFKLYLNEIECENVHWFKLAWDMVQCGAHVSTVISLQAP